ncbi:MAG: hypothetical protein K2U26_16685, partial [Cyclobacteriaceae bacterium]|nr:hypothetical protein [Cyclobacteriaceae bacterium]
MMRISTLALLLVVFLCLAAHAQRYDYVASSGTFTPITSATALDEIEADDVISSSFIPLGFTFNYFGTNYTQVRVSSNGFISFESPGSLSFNGIADGTASNLIAPLWDDLSGTGGQASYVTTGTGPNRVFTMEWLNWRWDYTALAAGISFQVKMYEGTNKIEFIYRQEAGALVSPDASIGLVGGTAPLFYSLDGSSSSALLAPAGVDIISTKPATGQVFAFTPSATPFTAPATQATNVNASGSGNNMSLNWTNGNGTYRAVFMKQTSSTTETVAPVDGTFYSPSSTFGNGSQVGTSGWYCVANLAGTFTTASINNLDNGFPYRIQVVEYNGLAGTQRYLSASATNNPVNFTTPVVTPTVSSSVQVLRTAATEVSISINNGNGARRAVFVRAGNSGTAPAVNSITYTANTLFGSGTQIGTTGWYCVFNGINAPSELIITGLAGNTDYRIHALDYNGANTTENYFISQITDNPAQLTTFVNVSVPTYTFSATAGTFTPISGGTDLNVIEEDEAQSGAVPIGFTFRHAGVAFTQLYASSNGFISFNPYSTGDFVNDLTAFVRRPLIAPLWDDLNGNTGQASYATTGTAPNRVFTLEWLNWKWSYFATAA